MQVELPPAGVGRAWDVELDGTGSHSGPSVIGGCPLPLAGGLSRSLTISELRESGGVGDLCRRKRYGQKKHLE